MRFDVAWETLDVEPSMSELLRQMATALGSRRATVAWAKGLTQDDLRGAWNECPDARALMRLCAPVTSLEILVQSACACIRFGLGETRGKVRAAVDTLDAWTKGGATWEQVSAAGEKASPEVHGGGESNITNALYAAASIREDPSRAMDVIQELCNALSRDDTIYSAAVAHLAPSKPAKSRVLAQLAEVVRATVPCPSVEALAQDP